MLHKWEKTGLGSVSDLPKNNLKILWCR